MPVGPNWVKTQLGTPIPQLPGVWYMHERQNQEGKHQPWLFFNASLGRYFRQRGDSGGKWSTLDSLLIWERASLLAGQLNRYCQKTGSQFEVSFSRPTEGNGFQCRLSIPGVPKVACAIASSKKTAQAAAVKEMHSFLSSNGMLDQVLADGPAIKKRKVPAANIIEDDHQVSNFVPEPPIQPIQPRIIPRGSVASGATAGVLKPGIVPRSAPVRPMVVQQGPWIFLPPPVIGRRPALPRPQSQPPSGPSPEDDAGNFSILIARSHLNEHLKKWRQPTDIRVVQDGPPHAPSFKAMLSFQVKGVWFNETHHAKTKKQATNELALKVCRKLFARGLLPKYKRNSTKGTFFDNLKDSKYFESSSFGLGLRPDLKERLRSYLHQHGYEAIPGYWEGRPHSRRDMVLAAVKCNGFELKFCTPKLQADKEATRCDVVLEAVRNNGSALRFAGHAPRQQRHVVLAAVTLCGTVLHFAGEALQADPEVVLAAVQESGLALRCAAPMLQGDRDIVLTAVEEDGNALEFAAEELQDDREVVRVATKEAGASVLRLASERLRGHPEFAALAASFKPGSLNVSRQTFVLQGTVPEELDPEEVGSIAALPWSSPEEGPSPWPEPKIDAIPDTYAAAIGAEASASLPIASKFQEIVDTVARNQVCIIQGSTGSGKTTQVPQYILDSQDEDGHPKTIVVTQPRRLAAITVGGHMEGDNRDNQFLVIRFVRFACFQCSKVHGK
eukprot:symbB.v1.2.009148.t2/scaffold548.1/size229490/8